MILNDLKLFCISLYDIIDNKILINLVLSAKSNNLAMSVGESFISNINTIVASILPWSTLIPYLTT